MSRHALGDGARFAPFVHPPVVRSSSPPLTLFKSRGFRQPAAVLPEASAIWRFWPYELLDFGNDSANVKLAQSPNPPHIRGRGLGLPNVMSDPGPESQVEMQGQTAFRKIRLMILGLLASCRQSWTPRWNRSRVYCCASKSLVALVEQSKILEHGRACWHEKPPSSASPPRAGPHPMLSSYPGCVCCWSL